MTKKKTTDINPERNEKYRQWENFKLIPILIILNSVLMLVVPIVLSVAWNRSERAIDAANLANATAGTWQTMYKETDRECRLAQNDIDDFRIALFKAGIEVEHTGETQ